MKEADKENSYQHFTRNFQKGLRLQASVCLEEYFPKELT